MRFDSVDLALLTAMALVSEGIGQKTGEPDVNLADEIEEPVVARVDDHRGLRAYADIQSFVVVPDLKLDQDREALCVA